MIPRERWDPAAAKIVELIPDPNVPGSTIYASTPVTETRQDQFDVRVDHQFAPGTSFFARYSFVDTNTFRPAPLPGLGEGSFNDAFGSNLNRSQGLAIGLTWIASSALVGDFRFGFARGNYFTNPPYAGQDSAAEFGIPNVPNDPAIVGGLPKMNIQGFDAVGRHTSTPQFQTPRSWNPRVDVHAEPAIASVQVRRRVPARADEDQRSQRDDRPHELRKPLHQPRHGRFPAGPAVAARADELHRDGSRAGHAVLLRSGRLSRDAEADAQPGTALRVRDASARARQSAGQFRPGDGADDLFAGRRVVRASADSSGSEQLRPATRLLVFGGRPLGRSRGLRHFLQPHRAARARRHARLQSAVPGRQPVADGRDRQCRGRVGCAVQARHRLSQRSAGSDDAGADGSAARAGSESGDAVDPSVQHRARSTSLRRTSRSTLRTSATRAGTFQASATSTSVR